MKFSPIAIITTIRSAKAADEFNALANDANSPQQLQRRAQAMAAFLKQGGAKDFGTVPPPCADAGARCRRPRNARRRRPLPEHRPRHDPRFVQAPASRLRARGSPCCLPDASVWARHRRHGGRLVRAQQQKQAARRAHSPDRTGRRAETRSGAAQHAGAAAAALPQSGMAAAGRLRLQCRLSSGGQRPSARRSGTPMRARVRTPLRASPLRRWWAAGASSRWIPKRMSMPSTPATDRRSGTSGWRPRTAPTCPRCGACWASPTPSSR